MWVCCCLISGKKDGIERRVILGDGNGPPLFWFLQKSGVLERDRLVDGLKTVVEEPNGRWSSSCW